MATKTIFYTDPIVIYHDRNNKMKPWRIEDNRLHADGDRYGRYVHTTAGIYHTRTAYFATREEAVKAREEYIRTGKVFFGLPGHAIHPPNSI